MKKNLQIALIISMLIGLVALPVLNQKSYAMPQRWVDPPTETPAPTQVPWGWAPNNGNVVNPAGNVPNNIVQQVTERPLLYIVDYHTSLGGKSVNPYGTFGLTFTIGNNGRGDAHGVFGRADAQTARRGGLGMSKTPLAPLSIVNGRLILPGEAEPVAGGKQRVRVAVPEGEGEHAVEAR